MRLNSGPHRGLRRRAYDPDALAAIFHGAVGVPCGRRRVLLRLIQHPVTARFLPERRAASLGLQIWFGSLKTAYLDNPAGASRLKKLAFGSDDSGERGLPRFACRKSQILTLGSLRCFRSMSF